MATYSSSNNNDFEDFISKIELFENEINKITSKIDALKTEDPSYCQKLEGKLDELLNSVERLKNNSSFAVQYYRKNCLKMRSSTTFAV